MSELIHYTSSQDLLSKYPHLLKAVALYDSEARPISIAGDIKEDLLQIIVSYQLETARIYRDTLQNNWLNFQQQGQILLLRFESNYLCLITYPSCDRQQLKEIINSLSNPKKNVQKSLTPTQRAFLDRCQQHLEQYLGIFTNLVVEPIENLYFSNPELFLEKISEEVCLFNPLQDKRIIYCQLKAIERETLQVK